MALSDLLKGAPHFLVKRYASLGPYIRAAVEKNDEGRDVSPLSKEQFEVIQTLAFVYVLFHFFEDSYIAASKTVETFASLKITNIRIGSAVLSEGSEDVERGRLLANDLLAALDNEDLRKMIKETPRLGLLVEKLLHDLRNDSAEE